LYETRIVALDQGGGFVDRQLMDAVPVTPGGTTRSVPHQIAPLSNFVLSPFFFLLLRRLGQRWGGEFLL